MEETLSLWTIRCADHCSQPPSSAPRDRRRGRLGPSPCQRVHLITFPGPAHPGTLTCHPSSAPHRCIVMSFWYRSRDLERLAPAGTGQRESERDERRNPKMMSTLLVPLILHAVQSRAFLMPSSSSRATVNCCWLRLPPPPHPARPSRPACATRPRPSSSQRRMTRRSFSPDRRMRSGAARLRSRW